MNKNPLVSLKWIYNMSYRQFIETLVIEENEYWANKFIAMRSDLFGFLCNLDENNRRKLFDYADAKEAAYTAQGLDR